MINGEHRVAITQQIFARNNDQRLRVRWVDIEASIKGRANITLHRRQPEQMLLVKTQDKLRIRRTENAHRIEQDDWSSVVRRNELQFVLPLCSKYNELLIISNNRSKPIPAHNRQQSQRRATGAFNSALPI